MEVDLSIAQVAKRTGLSVHTLRYYERIGLIAPVARASGGQRRYARKDLAWIDFLLRLRTTHMSIGTMQLFATLRGEGDATVPARRQLLQTHLAEVLAEIELLQQCAHTVQAKIEHYQTLESAPAPTTLTAGGNSDEHVESLRTRPEQTTRNRRGGR